jgi:hypothetical protein
MPLTEGVATTFTQGANSWLDDFNHGGSMAAMGAGYREFSTDVQRAKSFRHANHWMPDVQPIPNNGSTVGGSYLRPDRSFRFENGVLVIEMDSAAGISTYDPHPRQAWPEIVVSTADHPTPSGSVADDGYAYGHFPNAWTAGIRLQPSRVPIAALFNPGNTRTWERSFFQTEGAANEGGTPAPAWRTCNGTDPDTNCRDRFRWELRPDSMTLYVNGSLYWRQTQAGMFPAAFTEAPALYVYAASWISTREQKVYRFHWDRLRVNG